MNLLSEQEVVHKKCTAAWWFVYGTLGAAGFYILQGSGDKWTPRNEHLELKDVIS